MGKQSQQVHMTTTDSPLTGREIALSWMIWGAEARTLTEAYSNLVAIAASQGADAVIAVRFVAMPDTHTHHGIISGESIETRTGHQGYGTAIRYS
ncbi:hypothetical protein OHA19_08035 [Streptomyces sp. NBC_00012]|uniref:hypothetical protein n=1 Tax=Streptomyces sp. NBC_00012 TaxID=2975621 RepID=UPI003251751D